MTRWIILAVVVIVLTGAATFLVQYAPESDGELVSPVVKATGPLPKVEVTPDLTFDFGVMSQRDKGTHTWSVKNVGEGELELWLEGKPTCSCTVAELDTPKGQEGGPKKVVHVKPGDSTKINLVWETRNRENHYSQSATIGTNAAEKPTFTLAVHGMVHPPVMVVPPQLITLPQLSNEEPTRARIGVFSIDRPSTKVTKVTTSRPALITARAVPFNDEEKKAFKTSTGYRVEIEIKPGMPMGRFQDEIVIATDHPLGAETKVTITGTVTGAISVVPERLRMPNVLGSKGASREISLLVRGGDKTNFQIAHKPDKIEVAIAPFQTGDTKGRYRMTVKVPPGTTSGWVDDEIILKTDHPKATELKIPVSIIISNPNAG